MARHDAVELGERLDLIDNDAAHLRGAVRRFLRQLEDALAQLGAGRFQLALHLGGHPLEAVDDIGEALRRLREHGVGIAAGPVIERTHGVERAVALFLAVDPDRLEVLRDRAGAGGGGIRR